MGRPKTFPCNIKVLFVILHCGKGQGGGNPGEYGREVNGKREKTERDAGVVRGRDAGEEYRTLRVFSDFFVLFKLTIKN